MANHTLTVFVAKWKGTNAGRADKAWKPCLLGKEQLLFDRLKQYGSLNRSQYAAAIRGK